MYKKLYFLIALFILSISSFAQQFTVGGIKYSYYKPGEVEVTANQNFSGALLLPATVSNAGNYYSVTKIASFAFRNNSDLTSAVLPNSITTYGIYIFDNCYNLTSVTLPNCITEIPYGMFRNCSQLSSFTIPESVTKISDESFEFCTSLSSINIPASVTSIGVGSFADTALKSIKCDVISPIAISADVFVYVNQSACSLTVPSGSVNAYKNADVWKGFNPIVGDAVLATDNFTSKEAKVIYNIQNNTLKIISKSSKGFGAYKIYDSSGKLVKSGTETGNEILFQNNNSGIFILSYDNAGKTESFKFRK
jgi:hypothetical protein